MDKIAASIARVAAGAAPDVEHDGPLPLDLSPALHAALDAWIDYHPEPKPSCVEAIRDVLSDHLQAKGYLK